MSQKKAPLATEAIFHQSKKTMDGLVKGEIVLGKGLQIEVVVGK